MEILRKEEILTIGEVAERLKIKKSTIYQAGRNFVGRFKIGQQVRFKWSEIQMAILNKKNLVGK